MLASLLSARNEADSRRRCVKGPFKGGHQMGAWVMTLGLRAAVEVAWRLQINKPNVVIPMGQDISSTSAGAKSGNGVSLAPAKNARQPLAAVAPATSPCLPLGPSALAAGTCQAESRRHCRPGPLRWVCRWHQRAFWALQWPL